MQKTKLQKRELRQAVVPYSTNVQDRLHAEEKKQRSKIWNIASKLPLLLSHFSFLNAIKHWVHAPFYSYINARLMQCPLFVWMYVASQESQGSFRMHLDQCHKSSVIFTESSILLIQWRWKPMNKEYVGRRRVLAGSAHALTCFLEVSASDAYSLFTDRLKHIAHKNARASKIISFNLIGLIMHLLGLFWVYQFAWKRSCVYKMIQCFFSECFWHSTFYWFAKRLSLLKA